MMTTNKQGKAWHERGRKSTMTTNKQEKHVMKEEQGEEKEDKNK